MRKTLAALLLTTSVALGCTTRADTQKHSPPPLAFDGKGKVSLPIQASYAQKRGFADFTGDGITDMVEVNDEEWFGQDWKAKIFPGTKGENGLIHFDPPYKVKLPVKGKWSASMTKLDTADVNGDGKADIVMTQYIQRIGKDEYKVAFAMNNGDGKSFTYASTSMVDKLSTEESILRFLDAMDAEYVEDLSQYFKMDWADMNGDGKDDLCLFWDDRHNLYADIAFSGTPTNEKNSATFAGRDQTTVRNLLRNISIANLDTADYNGDGMDDIAVYRGSTGDGIRIAYAHNAGQRGFVMHKDHMGTEIDVDVVGFEKYDAFDVNFDGCDDYVHAGTHGSRKVLTYKTVACESTPEKK